MLIICIIIVLLILGVVLFINFWPALGDIPSKSAQGEYEKRTKLFYNNHFHANKEFKLIVSIKGNKVSDKDRINKRPKGNIPVEKIQQLPNAEIGEMKITWFGHSTSLLQMHGMNILIDPVLGEFASPLDFIGPKRMAAVPMTSEELPEIDLLLISHDHYDHMDYKTIKDIDNKVNAYCVPLGVESHLERWGVNKDKIYLMSWWDEIEINGLKVVSTPGQHFSGRLPWKNNSTSWCGYVLQDEYHSFYYSGDTGYGEFFKEINKRYGKLDLVLIENGQYDHRWPYCHMSPEDTFKAIEDLNAKWAIPVHWGGFVLANHSWNDPPERLITLAEKSSVSIATPRIGEIVDYNEINQYQEKWWR